MDELRSLQRAFLEELEDRRQGVIQLSDFRHGTGAAFSALTAKFHLLVRSFIQPALEELQSCTIEKSRLSESLDSIAQVSELYRSATAALSRHLTDQARAFSELYSISAQYAQCAVESDQELRRHQSLLQSLTRENSALRRANSILERRDTAQTQSLRECLATEATKTALLESLEDLREHSVALFRERSAAALRRAEESEAELLVVRESSAAAQLSLDQAQDELTELRLRSEIQRTANETLESRLAEVEDAGRARAAQIAELQSRLTKSEENKEKYVKAARHWKEEYEKACNGSAVEELEKAVREKEREAAELRERVDRLAEEHIKMQREFDERPARFVEQQQQQQQKEEEEPRPPPEVEPPDADETRMIEEEDRPEGASEQPQERVIEDGGDESEKQPNGGESTESSSDREREWGDDNNQDNSAEFEDPL
jgi:hypothetical protein